MKTPEDNFWKIQHQLYGKVLTEPAKKYQTWQPARWSANHSVITKIQNVIDTPIKTSIELGAGSAAFSFELRRTLGTQISALDISKEAKLYADQISKDMELPIEYINGDFFDFCGKNYDLVTSLGVIEHFDNDTQIKFLNKCYQLSNKYVLIAIPNQDSKIFQKYVQWSNKNNINYEEKHEILNLAMLEELIKNNGFDIIKTGGFQILLSEGQFWQESFEDDDFDLLYLKSLLEKYDKNIAKKFPDYNFLYDDIDTMIKTENDADEEYVKNHSFMQYVLAKKKYTTIRVIAPSRSMNIISDEVNQSAQKLLVQNGFDVTFGENIFKAQKYYDCATVEQRIKDLHNAFVDDNIQIILSVIGGANSNQMLPYIDYELIKNNPKMLCGFSDITAILNAIYAKTGVEVFYGPHYSSFGMKLGIDYTLEYFKKIMSNGWIQICPSKTYSDDYWYLDQNKRIFEKNEGFYCINQGQAEGTILGGNLCTFNLLQGTEYMPSLENCILFLEDDDTVGDLFFKEFDRNLESLIQQKDFKGVKGLIIGRSQKAANMNKEKWETLLRSKKELKNIPVLANVDFGHTTPIFTFPIGGKCFLKVDKKSCILKIKR